MSGESWNKIPIQDYADIDHMSETTSMSSTKPPPEGGWGWMVVFGSLVIQTVISGLSTSLGLFLVEWLEEFDASVSTTSWTIGLAPLLTGFLSKY